MTITLSSDIAAAVQGAVSDGEYASSSEVIREALRDWKLKREFQQREFEALKADIEEGLADLAAGRVTEVNVAEIVEEGRRLLAARARSGCHCCAEKPGHTWRARHPRRWRPASSKSFGYDLTFFGNSPSPGRRATRLHLGCATHFIGRMRFIIR